jgi:hypothetical protein
MVLIDIGNATVRIHFSQFRQNILLHIRPLSNEIEILTVLVYFHKDTGKSFK